MLESGWEYRYYFLGLVHEVLMGVNNGLIILMLCEYTYVHA